MRILLISSYFYPHQGGSQQYLEDLYCHLLRKYPSLKIDVIAYNTDKAKSFELYHNMRIFRVDCWQILPGQFAIPNYFSLLKLLRKLAHSHTYDFVQSNTRFFEHSWWTPLLAKKLKAKAILTDHCASHPLHKSKLITTMVKLIDSLVIRLIGRNYNLIIVTNKATLKLWEKAGVKKTLLVYGSVNSKFFNPQKRQKIRHFPNINHQFEKKDIVIAFVGRLIYTKGPQLLLEVAGDLTKIFPRLSFVIAGKGEMLEKLKETTTKHVYFTGAASRYQVARILANADILVHPSIHHEGFPQVLLEAGASGCPVIATKAGGVTELIKDKITGLIIQYSKDSLKKALINLIKNSNLRNKLSRNLRELIVKQFSWDKSTKVFYQELQNQVKI